MMRTGNRVFGGKRYDFFMFANTREDAVSFAKKFQARELKVWGHRVTYRVTEGKRPRSAPSFAGRRTRYLVWVRVTRPSGRVQ